ncbi:hypothetical protein BS47DRAFT_1399515 [Hydnum rufescens UP504]|uniref:Uncharacterized protein n=1 Tax=Hydnum rufescens UP504 TaxID=1448309 RepID=A0A9P6AII1_9AGAM|nr:hypothetical protein BS47DRAFT_1399515 [Hydnum rufescens UP504]
MVLNDGLEDEIDYIAFPNTGPVMMEARVNVLKVGEYSPSILDHLVEADNEVGIRELSMEADPTMTSLLDTIPKYDGNAHSMSCGSPDWLGLVALVIDSYVALVSKGWSSPSPVQCALNTQQIFSPAR